MKKSNKKYKFPDFFYMNQEIKESVLRMKEKIQTMQQMMKPFEELQKTWKENIDKWNIAFQPIVRAQKYLLEFAKRVAEVKEFKKEMMLETGWWFTPSLMKVPAVLIWETLSDYKEGRKNAVTNLFKKIYHHNDYKYLRETVKGWRESPFFNCRMEVIEDALDAHCQGKYTLSIPALLPVAEGIATEYCKKAKIYVEKDKSRGGRKIKKAIKDKDAPNESLHLDFLFNAIDEIIFKDTDQLRKSRSNYKIFLNRHAVLHGIQKNYATPKNSLQCFMLLDVLSLLES